MSNHRSPGLGAAIYVALTAFSIVLRELPSHSIRSRGIPNARGVGPRIQIPMARGTKRSRYHRNRRCERWGNEDKLKHSIETLRSAVERHFTAPNRYLRADGPAKHNNAGRCAMRRVPRWEPVFYRQKQRRTHGQSADKQQQKNAGCTKALPRSCIPCAP